TQPVQTQPVQTPPVQTPPVQTPPVQIQTVQIQPVEPVQVEPVQVAPVQISPVQLAPTDVRAAPIRPTLPQASPARATADPTAPPNVVPDFGFIPVPEDVAAAVRRAINAIESAMATAATPAAVSFGTMHVTSAGHENTFDQRDDAGRNGAGATNGRGAKNEMNGMTILDKATVVSQSRPGAPIAGLELLGDPDQLLHNPQAAPIGTARRGALRRLIDGIRHRG
ncbi:MAG: hypothetical protein ABIW84_07675, partial [Ilumatobacteraceae bacterium]